jgi:hypothetical protein
MEGRLELVTPVPVDIIPYSPGVSASSQASSSRLTV